MHKVCVNLILKKIPTKKKHSYQIGKFIDKAKCRTSMIQCNAAIADNRSSHTSHIHIITLNLKLQFEIFRGIVNN